MTGGASTTTAPRVDAARRRGWLVTVVALVVVVTVVAAVAALGGFRERDDRFTPVAIGSVVVTGPYEVTFDTATLTHLTDKDRWEVVASGSARTTGDTSIDPDSTSGGFVYARSPATREVQPSYTANVGVPDGPAHLDQLTPGLPAVPWSVTFTFAQPPGDSVTVVVFDQEYTTPWIFGDEMGWRATPDASTMTLPLTRGPDREF